MSLINQMLHDLEKRRASRATNAGGAMSGAAVLSGLSSVVETISHSPRRWYGLFGLLGSVLLITAVVWITARENRDPTDNLVQKPVTPVIAAPLKAEPPKPKPPVAASAPKAAVVATTAVKPTQAVAAAAPKPVTPADQMAQKLADAPPLPILIQTVQVTGDQTKTQLTIPLAQSILYTTDWDPSHQVLLLTLEHTLLARPLACTSQHDTQAQLSCTAKAVFPGLARTLIRQMDLVSNDGNKVVLRLTLADGALMQSLGVSEKKPLQLVLEVARDSNLPPLPLDASAPLAPSASDSVLAAASASGVQKAERAPTLEDLNEQAYQKALQKIQNGNVNEAITDLRLLVVKAPTLLPVRRSLIALLLQTSQLDEAETVLQEGLAQKADDLGLVKLSARLSLARNLPDQALQQLQRVANSVGSDTGYYGVLAIVYEQLNQFDKAEQIYQQLLEQEPYNASWWIGLGIAWEHQGKQNMALQAYQKALQGDNLTLSLRTYATSRIDSLEGIH